VELDRAFIKLSEQDSAEELDDFLLVGKTPSTSVRGVFSRSRVVIRSSIRASSRKQMSAL